jgi:protein gp37
VGCSKISPGCAQCYAAQAAKSARLQEFPQYQKVEKWDGTIEFVESQILKPLKWRSPKKIFTCSMSDVFHENVLDKWRDRAFAIMALCQQHTFQVLTKRPDIMLEYFTNPKLIDRIEEAGYEFSHNMDCLNTWPLKNVWLGVSVENQAAADERIPLLLQTPAAIRFLSCEPLLEETNIWRSLPIREYSGIPTTEKLLFAGINWIIIGGESGSKARQCHLGWIRSLVRQSQNSEVSVFVKQLGSNAIDSSPYIQGIADTNYRLKLNHPKGADISEWPEDLRIQQFPN